MSLHKGLTGCPSTTEYGEPDRFRSMRESSPAIFMPIPGAERRAIRQNRQKNISVAKSGWELS